MNTTERSPILIVGPTRSGKTTVAELLADQPEIGLAFEALSIWNIGFKGSDDDARIGSEATEEVVAGIRNGLAGIINGSGATRVVDDLVHKVFRVEFCHKVFPDARFVAVVRDGRESVAEMLTGWRRQDTLSKVVRRRFFDGDWRMLRPGDLIRRGKRWIKNYIAVRRGKVKAGWGPTAPGQNAFAAEHDLPATVAYQWTKMASHTLDAVETLPSEQVHLVRYDALLNDTAGEARRLAEFCGVSDPDRLVRYANDKILPAGRVYADQPSDSDWEQIMPIIKDVQTRLGYPADQLKTSSPDSRADSGE